MMPADVAQERAIAAQLASGDLVAARQALAAVVRNAPGDQRARMFLCQMLCIDGAWDGARSQLRALAQLSPEAQMLSVAYGQAIEAERLRAAAMAGEERAPLLAGGEAWAEVFVDALAAVGPDAGLLRRHALDGSPDMPGEIDGHRFDYLFDADSRFGPMFEAVVAGRWGLIPFAAVAEITSEGPVDLRDLVWLPAEIRLRDGAGIAALLPVRYPGTEVQEEGALRLARRTEWHEAEDAVHGLGQHLWTTSDGTDIGILGFRRIRFDPQP
ncbi:MULTISPECIES: type VI secretion system accessory protein TagJ [Sphingomonas]|uniref:Type VI secretion system protein ImpE n=1 Tax=Sphingomonas trueperi TaxID=53317 RepID=A0A7X6BAD6_9SPHN|nr:MULTISPECIES: type VI secretion system accessory protein TagJ [Sphingomonas]NJB95794.1 type VI secretion system protein ImpE [Sphingomonas trueperi]